MIRCRGCSALMTAVAARGPPANPKAPRRAFRATPAASLGRIDFNKEIKNLGEKLTSLLPGSDMSSLYGPSDIPPNEADVVIIGGGIMGWSIAYWLKKKLGEDPKVLVVEKDLSYSKASTVLSVGGIRQQYSLPENIRMSLYSARFLRLINDYLLVPGEPPVDIQFNPSGYLFLASEEGAAVLEHNVKIQRYYQYDSLCLATSSKI